MIAVLTEGMHGSIDILTWIDYEEPWLGKGKTINESEMALFSECML